MKQLFITEEMIQVHLNYLLHRHPKFLNFIT